MGITKCYVGDKMEIKEKHTKSPWKICTETSPDEDKVDISANNWGALARVVVKLDGKPSLEGEANANLIAASPEMRECLTDYIWREDGYGNIVLKIPKAKYDKTIKKIQGKNYEELKPCPFCGCTDIKLYRNGNSHYVYCIRCKSRSHDFNVSTEEEYVINSWNQRVL